MTRDCALIIRSCIVLFSEMCPARESVVNALWGMCAADAMSMPVHWFYNTRDITRDFGGWIRGLNAPRERHPSSILTLSNTGDKRHLLSNTSCDINACHIYTPEIFKTNMYIHASLATVSMGRCRPPYWNGQSQLENMSAIITHVRITNDNTTRKKMFVIS